MTTCDYDPEDYTPSCKVFEQSTPVARKDYMCDCGKVLVRGKRYSKGVGVMEGEFFVSRSCASKDDCESAEFKTFDYEC